MKSFLYLIIFLLCSSFIYSDCGDVINCPNKKYPYHQCYGGTGTVICTDNPQAVKPVLRKPDYIPICLENKDVGPVYNSPEEVKMPNQVGGDIVVFRREMVQNDIDCALDDWDCLCNMKNAPCGCKIKLYWSTNYREFNSRNTIAQANSATSAYTPNNCWLNCDKSKLILNNSPEFYGKASDGYRKYFLYNNELADNVELISNLEHKVVNLCDVITHEIGRFYGLAHYDEFPCPPDISSGIMNSSFNENRPKKGLSLDEKCAFVKWICPAYMPVEEVSLYKRKNHHFPNPFEGLSQIKFYLIEDSKVSIKVFDHLGNQIIFFEKWYNSGENIENIDLSNEPSGIYFYTIEANGDREIQKIVLIK